MSEFDLHNMVGLNKSVLGIVKTQEALLGTSRWLMDSISPIKSVVEQIGLKDHVGLRSLNAAICGPNSIGRTLADQDHFAKHMFAHEKLQIEILKHDKLQVLGLAKLYEPFLGGATTFGALELCRTLGDQFGAVRVLDTLYASRLDDGILGNALTGVIDTARLLGMPWKDPVGILSPLEETMDMGLTWADPEEPPKLLAAVLKPCRSQPAAPKIVCWVCKGELLTLSEFETDAPLTIHVVPICTTCARRGPEALADLERAVDALIRPPLRLVNTDGSTDGISRGKGLLRLVPNLDEGQE